MMAVGLEVALIRDIYLSNMNNKQLTQWLPASRNNFIRSVREREILYLFENSLQSKIINLSRCGLKKYNSQKTKKEYHFL